MLNFIFYNPTKIIFGKDTTLKIGKAIKEKRCLLIYGRGSIIKTGIYDKVMESLKKAGKEVIEKGGVKPNPILSFVYETIELARKEKVECVLAVGGGSVIDTAKTVAAGYYYDGDVWDFFINKAKIQKALPIYVVLTLSATGSEMNKFAVITNEKTKHKCAIRSEWIFPKLSILDPVNTYTVPKNQVAYGCVDAILHLVEGYFTKDYPNTPIQDGFVETLVKVIIDSTFRIFDNPKDYDVRAQFMWSATLALNGLTTAGIGKFSFSNHTIAHALSALYDLPHGATLSIVFPAWLKYHLKDKKERISRFGKAIFNETDPEKVILKIEELFTSLEVPIRLSQVNISEDAIPEIAQNAYTYVEFAKQKYLTLEEITEILKIAK